MSAAKAGDTVKVHYTGTLSDGTQFDSSRGGEPLEFTIGSGQLISGFNDAVNGMSVGDSKTVNIPSDQAYGEHNPEMMQVVPRSAIPTDIELEVGMVLSANNPDGRTLHFKVVEFDDEKVSVDGNHPLAGKDLTFDLELVSIG
ncbi:MAG: peptidylprolyl isomerase [Gammaproteobacteria bacterium]|nr:peptidylprolyl isomerase [Gammaproteobacteria bacterium]